MKINISNISDGIHVFNFDEPVSEINLGESFFGNFQVKFELSKIYNQIILCVELKLNAHFECDRCAASYNTVIHSTYQSVYFLGGKKGVNENSDVIYLPPNADKIDTLNDLKDYALLSVPMKKLCKENCKGLCIKCGKDLNNGECDCETDEADYRWFPLEELRKKLNN